MYCCVWCGLLSELSSFRNALERAFPAKSQVMGLGYGSLLLCWCKGVYVVQFLPLLTVLAVSVLPQFLSSHNFRNLCCSVDLITVLDTALLNDVHS